MLITCLCRACATCLFVVCIVPCVNIMCCISVVYQCGVSVWCISVVGVSVSSVLHLSFVSANLFTELN